MLCFEWNFEKFQLRETTGPRPVENSTEGQNAWKEWSQRKWWGLMDAWPAEVDTLTLFRGCRRYFDDNSQSTLMSEGEVGRSVVPDLCPGVTVGLNSISVFQRGECWFCAFSSPAIAGEYKATSLLYILSFPLVCVFSILEFFLGLP